MNSQFINNNQYVNSDSDMDDDEYTQFVGKHKGQFLDYGGIYNNKNKDGDEYPFIINKQKEQILDYGDVYNKNKDNDDLMNELGNCLTTLTNENEELKKHNMTLTNKIKKLEDENTSLGLLITELTKSMDENTSTENECCICFNAIDKNICLVPCGHRRICGACVTTINKCPFCYCDITLRMNLY